MALYADRVKQSLGITGTGTVTLTLATTGTGYQSFLAAFGTGTQTVAYCIADQSGPNWEVGTGSYNGSANTLARTTVLASSNGGSLTNFSGGTQDVFCTAPAKYLDTFTSTNQGTVPASGGGTSNFLRADGTFAAPPAATPASPTTSVQFNNAGAFGGSANFTYTSGTNTVSFGNITGSALGMTIQPKAPTSLENPGTLLLQGQDATKANTTGGSVRLRPGAKTGVGVPGSVFVESQDNNYNLTLNNYVGFYFTDANTSSVFRFSDGIFNFVGSQTPPSADSANTFITGLNSTLTGNVSFQFLTDSQVVFEFGEPTFGSQEMAFFGVVPVTQPTTATASATRAAVIGTVANIGDTYDGYTLAKVVKALRNLGILA